MIEVLNDIGAVALVVLALIGVGVLRHTIKGHTFEQEPHFTGDDPLVDVLHRALANRTGRIPVSEAYLICGIDPSKASQDQITRFGRAIRALGWELQQRRYGGTPQYAAYVRGTAAERTVNLIVEYDPHLRSARIGVDAHTPSPN